MDFLGCAVYGIVMDGSVGLDTRLRLASQYMALLAEHEDEKLPEKAYRQCESTEPTYVVEVAVFLCENGVFDWGNTEALTRIVQHASPSSLEAKQAFLSKLVDELNRNPRLLSFLTKPRYVNPLIETIRFFGLEAWNPRLEGISKAKQNLVFNLQPFLVSSMGRSTFGELCRITYLTREDLERIFLKLPMALMLENKSDVRALRDLLMCLLDGSREPEVIIKRLLKQVSELKEAGFDYEARLKALCQVAEERGLVDAGFIGLVRGLLGERMETSTRLHLFKFVYAHTRDVRVLHEAAKCRSSRIREWAKTELKRS
jgi:hypothetical protein